MSIFNSIKIKPPKRSAFNLSHEVKLTCDFGQLVPFFCQEVLPGDSFKITAESLVRFAPLKTPMMSRCNVYTHFFFVPNRLIWENWKEFITGGEDGTASPVFPTITFVRGVTPRSLADYLGIPTNKPKDVTDRRVSALPFRAYWEIFNEYYRDQNLQEPLEFSKGDGNSDVQIGWNIAQLQKRCWAKDYFTSALPYPQRLPNPVTMPVDTPQQVVRYRKIGTMGTGELIGHENMRNTPGLWSLGMDIDGKNIMGKGKFKATSPSGSSSTVDYDPNGTLFVDKTESSFNINDLRKSFSLQRWLENNARAGSRYIEQILSHFGVRSSDARLQRPEFLGGGKIPVVVSDVPQTSQTTESSPQGELAGNATAYGANGFTKDRFFEEHGIIIGIMSVMPAACYQDGIPRFFMKRDKFDFAFPEFAHLGEQEVYQGELFYKGEEAEDKKLFGYQPRYAEYRFINSSVHGDFRDTLSQWVMARRFSEAPALNETFVKCGDKSLNDVFAVQDTEFNNLWCQIYINCKAVRPLPKYGTPGL